MSVQSESGRLDYHKSDTSPKGTQMAGDVLRIPDMSFQTYNKARDAQEANKQSLSNIAKEGSSSVDTTNLASKIIRKP